MKLKTLLMSITMAGTLTALVSAQTTESCYRASVDSLRSVSLSGSPDSISLSFSSSTLLSGPNIGEISGEFQFDIFGGDGLTATYDNGALVVNGYVAGNLNPLNVKVDGVKLESKWSVCSTDVKTWTMVVDSDLNEKIAEQKEAGDEVFFGNVTKEGTDVQKLSFDQVSKKGQYRISGAEFKKLADATSVKLYTSDDGGKTLNELSALDSSGLATEFYDFDFCVCAELVPEPSSVSLLGLGGIALLLRRRR